MHKGISQQGAAGTRWDLPCAAFCIFFALLGAAVAVPSIQAQTLDPDAKFRLAQGFEQAGEYERAADLYRELLQKDPGNFVCFDGLQRMYVQLKRYDDAIAVINDRLKRQPGDAALYGTLGTVQYRAGREREAMDAWERAIAQAPRNQQSYRLIASLMIENRLLDRAADVYRRGRVACGDDRLFTIELAQLLVASMDYTGATEEYLRWLSQNPAQIVYIEGRLAAFTYKDEGRAAATRVVQTRLNEQPSLRLYEILAWLHMEGKDFQHAFDVYRRIDALSNADGVALLGFADRVFREHAYDVAIRAYREAMSRSLPPQRAPQARYGYACAMLEDEVFSDSADVPAWAGAGTRSEARTPLTDAISAFSQIVTDYPQTEYSARSLYQIGVIQLRYLQDLDSALRTFRQVLAEPAARPSVRADVQLRLAELLIARAETTAANASLQSVLGAAGVTPDQMDEAQLRLAEIAFFNGRIDDALKLLATIATNVKNDFANDALELQVLLQENTGGPPEALAQYGRAEFLSRQHKNSEAVALLTDLATRYPASPLVDDALLRAGALLTSAARYQEALALYQRMLSELHEKSRMLDRALLRMGEVEQFGLHQPGKAIASYEQLLAEYPQSILAETARKRIRNLRGESL